MHWIRTTVLLCLLSSGTRWCLAEESTHVDAKHPFLQYLGAWQTNSAGPYTVYPGSQVRFSLKGAASLAVRSGMPGTIRAAVLQGGSVVWSGLLDQTDIALDAGASTTPLSVVYQATNKRGFDSSLVDAKGAEFRFEGLTLRHGAALSEPPQMRREVLLDFVGDSITAGVNILGRSDRWMHDSDASLTYAFQLAESLGVSYRIRAFPGVGCDTIAGKFPFFQKGMPLPANEQPDVVYVNIGANDREETSPHYRTQMQKLLDVILRTYPKTKVVLLNFCRMTPNRLPVLMALAQSYSNGAVSCFDARPYLVGYSDEGVHPDVESHKRLAEALAARLRASFENR